MYNELNYRYNDNNFRHNINILIHFKKYFQDIHQCTSNKKKLIIIIKKYLNIYISKRNKTFGSSQSVQICWQYRTIST
jgi:putative transposon-encoded protein